MLKIAGILLTLFLALPGVAEAGLFGPDWNVYKDYPYGSDPAEKADFYLLKGQGHPVVLFIHGGGWSAGDKSAYAGYYANMYANAGFSVISMNYRLAVTGNPSTQWPAQLQDVQLLVRWVRQYAYILGIDPNRICAYGDSAGGHLALFLGALKTSRAGDRSGVFPNQSPTVNCVVDMFGPSDLTAPDFRPLIDGAPFLGGQTYAQNPQLYADASPVRYVTAQMSPTFVAQGTADTIVPYSQGVTLVNAFTANHVYNWWVPFVGGHEFINTPSSTKKNVEGAALNFVKMFLHP